MNLETYKSAVDEFIQAYEGFDINTLKIPEQVYLQRAMRVSLKGVLQLTQPPIDALKQLPPNALKQLYITNLRSYIPKTEEEYESIISTLNTLLRAFRVVSTEHR